MTSLAWIQKTKWYSTNHRLAGNELDDAGVTRLDKFGRVFNGFTRTTIDLLDELGKFAGDVGGVTVENRGVTGTNLTRVVEDDDLCVERGRLLGGIVLGVGGHVPTTDILH